MSNTTSGGTKRVSFGGASSDDTLATLPFPAVIPEGGSAPSGPVERAPGANQQAVLGLVGDLVASLQSGLDSRLRESNAAPSGVASDTVSRASVPGRNLLDSGVPGEGLGGQRSTEGPIKQESAPPESTTEYVQRIGQARKSISLGVHFAAVLNETAAKTIPTELLNAFDVEIQPSVDWSAMADELEGKRRVLAQPRSAEGSSGVFF